MPRPWGVSATTVGRLCRYGAPYSLLQILAYLGSLNATERNLDFVEIFSGVGELTAQMRCAGLAAQDFELNNNPLTEDICSDLGFLNAVHLVSQLLMTTS